MGTSRVPATIDAFVAALTVAGILAWDGPVVTEDFQSAIFVGYDGNPDGDFQSVLMAQQWAGLGNRARSESFDLICAAVVLLGNEVVKPARDATYALVATAETVLRGDPTIGQAPMFVAQFMPQALYIEPTTSGFQARLVFHVHIETRI